MPIYMGMLTITDVAKRAGVSRSAVSHVLNQRDHLVGLCPSTRQRILKAIRDLGYHRNEAARSIRSGQSRIIAFMSSDIDAYYVAAILSEVLNQANHLGLFI